jgi:hypothetical protein
VYFMIGLVKKRILHNFIFTASVVTGPKKIAFVPGSKSERPPIVLKLTFPLSHTMAINPPALMNTTIKSVALRLVFARAEPIISRL